MEGAERVEAEVALDVLVGDSGDGLQVDGADAIGEAGGGGARGLDGRFELGTVRDVGDRIGAADLRGQGRELRRVAADGVDGVARGWRACGRARLRCRRWRR